MKKILTAILTCALLVTSLVPAFGEGEEELVLRVYNWQEYINDGTDEDGRKVDKSVMELWEEDYYNRTGQKVRVQYDTFETNETMLNTLRTGKTSYDLVCPSDYIIQKMLIETQSGIDEKIMLEKFDLSRMPNYTRNVSPYISELFDRYGWTDYAVCYMWGSVGLLYDPEKVMDEDVRTWDILWNPEYKNVTTCKDTSRDAYVIGLLKVYADELKANRTAYDGGEIDGGELQRRTHEIANRVDDESIAKVEAALKEMKNNIYGFEVDSGKGDIVTGKINANVAWSGDAVYAMDLAEEEDDKYLKFVVPDEGSTIWFDGWVMPRGANVELAQDFVNFMCDPAIAAMNVDFIGYTSAIAGDEIFDLMLDWYDEEDGEIAYDLTYFFDGTLSDDRLTDGKAIIRTSEKDRQLMAQYPDVDTTYRCGIMEDYGAQNEKVLSAWSKVKGTNLPVWIYILAIVVIVAAIGVVIAFGGKKKKKRR
ncbi:MAG: extracellular solute-binding protein [Clostridia bacterium]